MNALDEKIERLKKQVKLDEGRFPEAEYINHLREIKDFECRIRGLLTGGVKWFEQADLFSAAEKCLEQMDRICQLFGHMSANAVVELLRGLQRKIIVTLQIPAGGYPGLSVSDVKWPPSPYPRARCGAVRSVLEMSHSFFHLAENQQLELRNTGDRDFLHCTSLSIDTEAEKAKFFYRIPCRASVGEQPPWIAIPPFEVDPRPNIAEPRSFISARDVFIRRGILGIRIVKKSESKVPITWHDEIERAKQAELDRATEIEDLIESIKNSVVE